MPLLSEPEPLWPMPLLPDPVLLELLDDDPMSLELLELLVSRPECIPLPETIEPVTSTRWPIYLLRSVFLLPGTST